MQPKEHFYLHQVTKKISDDWKDKDLLNSQTKTRINLGKSVVDQRKGNIMQKELLSPVERLEEETRDNEMRKVDNSEVYFDIVD